MHVQSDSFKPKLLEKRPLCLYHVPTANMEEAGFITYTAASHQVVINVLWLHFWGAVVSAIFINSLVWMIIYIVFIFVLGSDFLMEMDF